ncbi:MAG: hypothetical protein J0I12_07385 [Candidatus Eremiobacteraeota bacterium]|nr:hypothetical protein [Candidatus Eremiobacteraeota bacterium]
MNAIGSSFRLPQILNRTAPVPQATTPSERFQVSSESKADQAKKLREMAGQQSARRNRAVGGMMFVLAAQMGGVALGLSIPVLACALVPAMLCAGKMLYHDSKSARLEQQANQLDPMQPPLPPAAPAPAPGAGIESSYSIGLDGKPQVRIDNTTIAGDGSSVTRTEDVWYSSDGKVSQRIGGSDLFLRSDGVTEAQVGDFIIRSDGSTSYNP